MNNDPKYCSKCGGPLVEADVKPSDTWHDNLVCLNCDQKVLVIYGDTQGGAPYCTSQEVTSFEEEAYTKT